MTLTLPLKSWTAKAYAKARAAAAAHRAAVQGEVGEEEGEEEGEQEGQAKASPATSEHQPAPASSKRQPAPAPAATAAGGGSSNTACRFQLLEEEDAGGEHSDQRPAEHSDEVAARKGERDEVDAPPGQRSRQGTLIH